MLTIKTISSSKITTDMNVFMTLYRGKEIFIMREPVKLISRPDCQISSMLDDDEFIFESENDRYLFKRNSCEPFFLVTKLTVGNKSNLFRVKFEAYVEEKIKQSPKKPGRPKNPPVFGPPVAPRKRGRPKKNS